MSDRRRIADDQSFAHFVTFSCHKRRRLLGEDQPKRIVPGQLNQQLQRQAARCVEFLIMPDHVHAVVWFPQTGQLSRVMANWKRAFVPGATFFFTVVTERRAPFLCESPACRLRIAASD